METVALSRAVVVGEVANTDFSGPVDFDTLLLLGAFRAGPSRKRLESFGVDLTKVSSLNLCSPGQWDPDEAVANANELLRRCRESWLPHHVLAFGSRCSMAFGLKFEPFKTRVSDNAVIVSLPHPSGLSRWWNERDNQDSFRHFVETVHGFA